MTTRYFPKSIFQDTGILYTFMVSILSKVSVNPVKRYVTLYNKMIFAGKRHQYVHINWKYKGDVGKTVSQDRQNQFQIELESNMFGDIL